MRTVVLLSVLLVLAGCAHKPSAGERQKRYDELCVAVERAEAKQADLRREATSYGIPKHADDDACVETARRLGCILVRVYSGVAV